MTGQILISMFVDSDILIMVYPAGRRPEVGAPPSARQRWIVKVGDDLDLHFETREKLTELRDAITAALDAADPS